MIDINTIIKECKKNNPSAQRILYERYSPWLRGICLRYARDTLEAKDILQESFLKIYSGIRKFKGKGSFEGWMQRIVINHAINQYRKNAKKHDDELKYLTETEKQTEHETDMDDERDIAVESTDDIEMEHIKIAELSHEELLEALNLLPEKYRIVFNLHCIENYKHQYIAELLKIELNTSRSRLSRARTLLQQRIKEMTVRKLKKIENGYR